MSSPMMHLGLNLNDMPNADTPTVPVTLGDRTWNVRSDFTASVAFEMFLSQTVPLEERLQAAINKLLADYPDPEKPPDTETKYAALVGVRDTFNAEQSRALSALLRFSGYMEMTPEKVTETFTPDECKAILDYFFTLRTRQSSTPSPAGTTTPSASTKTTTKK